MTRFTIPAELKYPRLVQRWSSPWVAMVAGYWVPQNPLRVKKWIWWISSNLRSFGAPPDSQLFPGREWVSLLVYIRFYYIFGMVKYHLHIMFLFAIRLCPKSSQNTSTSAQFSSGHSACCAGLNVTLFKQRTKGNTCANIPNKYNNTQYMWHYMWYLYLYMYMCIYACMIVSV